MIRVGFLWSSTEEGVHCRICFVRENVFLAVKKFCLTVNFLHLLWSWCESHSSSLPNVQLPLELLHIWWPAQSPDFKLYWRFLQDSSPLGRKLHEIGLEESVRYAPGDPIEHWLNRLLCLDCAATPASSISAGCPPPDACDLYPFMFGSLLG